MLKDFEKVRLEKQRRNVEIIFDIPEAKDFQIWRESDTGLWNLQSFEWAKDMLKHAPKDNFYNNYFWASHSKALNSAMVIMALEWGETE